MVHKTPPNSIYMIKQYTGIYVENSHIFCVEKHFHTIHKFLFSFIFPLEFIFIIGFIWRSLYALHYTTMATNFSCYILYSLQLLLVVEQLFNCFSFDSNGFVCAKLLTAKKKLNACLRLHSSQKCKGLVYLLNVEISEFCNFKWRLFLIAKLWKWKINVVIIQTHTYRVYRAYC